MDFVTTDVQIDDDSRSVTFSWLPDPDRYERREVDGVSGWYDLLDDTFIPDDVYRDMVDQLAGTPMYFQKPLIDDSLAYARGRRVAVQERLQTGVADVYAADKSAEALEAVELGELGFAILVVDLVGSTRLSQALKPDEYARTISVVVSELSELVPNFLGHVLKYTGDGLIAFFPEPSFNRMNDLAIDCAMSMTLVLREAINPSLVEAGLPELELRVGLESGNAYVTVLGTPDSKLQRDIIGEVINIAAKIQALAEPGEVLVGGSMNTSLHVFWRKVLQLKETGPNWKYVAEDGSPYPVYKVAIRPQH